jgi:hypothetical protein
MKIAARLLTIGDFIDVAAVVIVVGCALSARRASGGVRRGVRLSCATGNITTTRAANGGAIPMAICPPRNDEQTCPYNLTLPRAPRRFAGIVPIPDPTTLTNQLVSRATQAIREVLETKIEDVDNRLNRLESMLFERLVTTMETNNALYSQKLLGVHSEIDALRFLKAHDLASLQSRVDGVAAFYDEKFRSLDGQTSKAVIDVRIAMDAAFAAAKQRFFE